MPQGCEGEMREWNVQERCRRRDRPGGWTTSLVVETFSTEAETTMM